MIRSLVRPVTKVSATWSSRSTRTTTRKAAEVHQQHLRGRRRRRRCRCPCLHQQRAEQRGDGVEHDEQQPEQRTAGGTRETSRRSEKLRVGPGLLLEVEDGRSRIGRQRLDPGQQLGGRGEGQLPPARRASRARGSPPAGPSRPDARRPRGRRRHGSRSARPRASPASSVERLDRVADRGGGLVVEPGQQLAVGRVALHQLVVGAVVDHATVVEERRPGRPGGGSRPRWATISDVRPARTRAEPGEDRLLGAWRRPRWWRRRGAGSAGPSARPGPGRCAAADRRRG